MIVPVVKGIAPELTCLRESIGRNACHPDRIILIVKLEQLWMGLGIGTVVSHIDRQVTDQLDTNAVYICFELCPLFKKLIL